MHEDVQIFMLHWPESCGGVESPDCIVTFDGGAAGAQGTGGFLVWGRRAQL